ncbi:MAG: fumarylacetoacetate hydrolase family protein, partial [Betaproteobacteria bacterium]|nr:fumarylacetoacetate hydrolase family protein [Betaproteobacteria bacterium]
FAKPGDAVVGGNGEIAVHYPPATANLHHEVELVVALAGGGAAVPAGQAASLIFGYAVGLDLTRRDLQAQAKAKGHPWDMGKGFDQSAVCGPIVPVAACGHPAAGRIWLTVNGQMRQTGDLASMLWKVPEIVAQLSTLVRLAPGDLIYTGTPAGVGAIVPGDVLEGGVDGVGRLRVRLVD